MDFCLNCGTRLVSKPSEEGIKDGLHMVCPKCGYKKQGKQKLTVAPKSIKRFFKPSITVISKEHQIRTLPTTDKACPKCGNNLAFYWQVQTRHTNFMRKLTNITIISKNGITGIQ